MFTGIIQTQGSVEAIDTRGGTRRLWLIPGRVWSDLEIGESIALNGACLTLAEVSGDRLGFDLSSETVQRSTLGELRVHEFVNLERALRANDRLGGHFVLGHVDGVGTLIHRQDRGSDVLLRLRLPPKLRRFVVPQGSIAVDGISLTVAEIRGDLVSASMIPFTARHTTLGAKRVGAKMNIEVDMLVKAAVARGNRRAE
jgi:riboflavin synthase